MKIVSTNLSKPKTVFWKGKPVQTGIFKEPVDVPIELGEHDVIGDSVIDRKYHGGKYQACYLYSADHYDFWKKEFPSTNMPYGMFGENITVEGLDEKDLFIGAKYQLGTAVVQVSQPREPCFKLGIRFGDQTVLKKMINSGYCGTYVKVLKPGKVRTGDSFELIENQTEGLSIAEVFNMIYAQEVHGQIKQKLINDQFLRNDLKVKLISRHGV